MIADDLFQEQGLVINQGKSPVKDLSVGNEFMRGFQGITYLPRNRIKPLKYGQGMGKQILWMVNQNLGRAEIRLNPANLGPMEVRIDLDNDQVSVAFTSRHAEVRDAVEQALPRLPAQIAGNRAAVRHTVDEVADGAFIPKRETN